MRASKTKIPLSAEISNLRELNFIRLLLFATAAVFGGMFLDGVASKIIPSAYDGLYNDRVETLFHGTESRCYNYYPAINRESGYWKTGYDDDVAGQTEQTGYAPTGLRYHIHGTRKFYGIHPYATRVYDGRDEAHNGVHVESYYDESKRVGGQPYPMPERKLLAIYIGLFAALLLLTPLGPQYYLARRRELLEENRADYEMALSILGWIGAQGNPFAGDKGTAEPGIMLKPLRVDFNPNSDASAKWLAAADFLLFAEDADGKPWCVVAPSTEMTRRFVRQTVQTWLGQVSANTHVGKALRDYSFGMYEPRALPTLNAIISDMEHNPDVRQRKEVLVSGSVVDDKGLLIATNFSRDGEQDIFLPTAFMAALTAQVKELTGRQLPPAQPLSLVAA